MKLEVISTRKGNIDDIEGWVEFKAFFMENGVFNNIHENSYFVKEKGIWYYKSGNHQN